MDWASLTFRERVSVVLAALVVLAMGLFMALKPETLKSPNLGLGKDWQCANPGEGDSVCVKRVH